MAKASPFEQTVPANSLESLGKTFSQLFEQVGIVPDIFQGIACCVPEYKLRNRLTYTAQCV